MTARESNEDQVAERFARESASHEMTVLHDVGQYRHLRFRGKRIFYWFELITIPNALIFRGDGQSFVFSRDPDMFEFFRGPVGRINPGYWAEKITSGKDGVKSYDEATFRESVIQAFVDEAPHGVPSGTGRALRERVLEDEEIHYEEGARAALDRFEHKGFGFSDTWEWDFSDWDWWFLWACHAIVWGIAYYDAKARPAMPEPQGVAPRRKVRPERRVVSDADGTTPGSTTPHQPRPIVDVQLPEPVGGAA